MGKRLIINPGMKFNRLTIIREKSYKPPGGVRRRVFLCQCSCKNKTHLAVGLYDLTSGHTKSCGCYKQEIHTTHGVSDHPLYMVYFDMIDRCYNKNHQAYKNYGGRKIRVCLKWRLKIKYRGLKNFVYWAENNGWKKGLYIDRRDNNENYSPDNCRFISRFKSNRNKRSNIWVNWKGKKMLLIDVVRKSSTKIPYRTVLARHIRLGWSLEKSLSTPKKKNQYG